MVLVVVSACWSCRRRALAQDTHLLVITGVDGRRGAREQFQKWATALIDAAKKKDGVADANITYLADKASATRRGSRPLDQRERRKAFADLAARAKPNDEVFVC